MARNEACCDGWPPGRTRTLPCVLPRACAGDRGLLSPDLHLHQPSDAVETEGG